MELDRLKTAIEKSWGLDTCYPGSTAIWSTQNPAVGQCTVTALVVQDFFGGEILHCDHHNHNWNLVPGLGEIDLSRKQFLDGTVVCKDGMRTREQLLASEKSFLANTSERYATFKARVLLELQRRQAS